MFELGSFRLNLIDDGRFELKGDAFKRLGGHSHSGRVAPRVLIGFNSLLVRGNGHTLLIDPGTGDKLLGESYRRYQLEWPRKVLGALDELGVRREEVDTVILTHLHWDHAGASTTTDAFGTVIPTFPSARYFLQRRELETARAALAEGDDGFIADDFEPLVQSGVLKLLETDGEIVPGISVRWVGGHCPGLQIVYIDGGAGRAIYLSDLVPTHAQLPLNNVFSFDLDHRELIESKQAVLEEAADRHDLLLFVHSPRSRAGYISRKQSGEYEFSRVNL